MRPQPGDLINGKYRLVRLIGDGGMGSVFEARHEYLGTVVALKFLHSELASRPGLIARFLREARLSASIKSEHIARVTDVDQARDGAAYLVMELLEGDSLRGVLEREGKLSPEVALDYTLQILAGLEAAHSIGVVHRDLKPDNVFIVNRPQGPFIKLLDFGIAKLRTSKEYQAALTRPGAMMGTPEYMAPEQAYSADTVDVRADVFSVGAILYEMLAGQRPAQGDDPLEIAAFVLAQKVPRLNTINDRIAEGLAAAVHRAMAAQPNERFASVADLRQALLPFCGSLSVAGRLAATPQPGGVATTLPPPPDETPPPKTEASPLAYAPAEHHVPQPAPMPIAPVPTPGLPNYSAAVRSAPFSMPSATRSRSPRRISLWLLFATCALAIGVVVAAVTTAETTDHPDDPATTTPAAPVPNAPAVPIPSSPARPTVTAPTPAIPPPVQPTAAPVTPPAGKPAAKPQPAADAGAGEAAPGAGLPTIPGFPFPLPSAFPLPSSLPIPIPLPSGFPPFTLPGFPPPAPAPSPAP